MSEKMNFDELKAFLDEKTVLYNNPGFIQTDPIQIPHLFTQKEDIEISGFLAATIAWGNRKMIIANASKMMWLMGNSPYDFVISHSNAQLEHFDTFVHRTFNSNDMVMFIKALRNIYKNHGGLESVFTMHKSEAGLQQAIHQFKKIFFETPHQQRTKKHVSDPVNGSAAKRINMLMRVIKGECFIVSIQYGVGFLICRNGT